jgi:hypothetical protein
VRAALAESDLIGNTLSNGYSGDMLIGLHILRLMTSRGLRPTARTVWAALPSFACMLAMSNMRADMADHVLRSPLLSEPPPRSFLLRSDFSSTYDATQLIDLPIPNFTHAQNEDSSAIARIVISTLKQRTGYDGQTAISSENRETLFTENEGGPRVGVSTSQLARLAGQRDYSSWDVTVRSALPSETSREIAEREYTIRYHFFTLGVVTDAIQEMNTYRIRLEWRW